MYIFNSFREDSKLIFPKVDLIIDKNGINQLSNPQNTLTKFKIISKNMQVAYNIPRNFSKLEGDLQVLSKKQFIVWTKSK
jgi:hypothetical protein